MSLYVIGWLCLQKALPITKNSDALSGFCQHLLTSLVPTRLKLGDMGAGEGQAAAVGAIGTTESSRRILYKQIKKSDEIKTLCVITCDP